MYLLFTFAPIHYENLTVNAWLKFRLHVAIATEVFIFVACVCTAVVNKIKNSPLVAGEFFIFVICTTITDLK